MEAPVTAPTMDPPRRDLKTVVRETWEQALDASRIVSVAAVADQVIGEYPDLVEVEASHLVRRSLIRWIKGLARTEAEQSSDLTLFGFPAVIAIPIVPDEDDEDAAEDGYGYIRTLKAVWPELTAGSQIREANVRRAVQKLDVYTIALERVRPLMEGTDKTLAEALAAA